MLHLHLPIDLVDSHGKCRFSYTSPWDPVGTCGHCCHRFSRVS